MESPRDPAGFSEKEETEQPLHHSASQAMAIYQFDHEQSELTLEPNVREPERESGTFALLVVDDEGCERHVLPTRGEIVIGRGADADVRVRRPWISRRHAVIQIGERMTIQDAGSSYGLKIRGEARATADLVVGDVVEMGSTMIVVQRTDAIPDRTALLAGLREDCARAQKLGLELDVVAVETSDPVIESLVSSQALTRFARIDGYCVAVAHRAASGEALALRLGSQLAARGSTATIGTATFPRDADRADSLLARATAGFASVGETGRLVFADDESLAMRSEIERLARTEANVVFEGESGSGKDALADLLHSLSGPGRVVRLGRVALLGLNKLPDATTIVLEDVADLTEESQARILSILFPVGGPRIVTTTLKSLDGLRPDLYHRLAGAHLYVAPLRERPRDLESLARRFVTSAAENLGRRRAPTLSQELITALESYPWPGNVRELENAVGQAVASAEAITTLRPCDMPRLAGDRSSRSLRTQLAQLERQRIVDALDKAGGNQSAAARDLGMPRNTLLARIREYGLPQPRKDKARLAG